MHSTSLSEVAAICCNASQVVEGADAEMEMGGWGEERGEGGRGGRRGEEKGEEGRGKRTMVEVNSQPIVAM